MGGPARVLICRSERAQLSNLGATILRTKRLQVDYLRRSSKAGIVARVCSGSMYLKPTKFEHKTATTGTWDASNIYFTNKR